jgi:hypothetical protein
MFAPSWGQPGTIGCFITVRQEKGTKSLEEKEHDQTSRHGREWDSGEKVAG